MAIRANQPEVALVALARAYTLAEDDHSATREDSLHTWAPIEDGSRRSRRDDRTTVAWVNGGEVRWELGLEARPVASGT